GFGDSLAIQYRRTEGLSYFRVEYVNQAGVLDPVAEAILPAPRAEGIYAIRLADYELQLKPNIEYEWFLTLILDEEERSSDFTAGATLRYRAPSAEEANWQTRLPKAQRPQRYAEHGLWYDAFDSLSQLIAQAPQQLALKKSRRALLNQAQLPRAAVFDLYQ
ncbi:MAG: DUF928 domain-containing protein, partial [Pseudomonadales bacterium]